MPAKLWAERPAAAVAKKGTDENGTGKGDKGQILRQEGEYERQQGHDHGRGRGRGSPEKRGAKADGVSVMPRLVMCHLAAGCARIGGQMRAQDYAIPDVFFVLPCTCHARQARHLPHEASL